VSRTLRAAHPDLVVVGHDSSAFDLEADPAAAARALRQARDAGARVIFVCLPARKQAMLDRFEAEYRPAVGIGAGSALAFYAGEVRRAPAWMSRAGLEWVHRVAMEPRRLWRRYLVDAGQVVPVFAGMILDRLSRRGRPSRLDAESRPA
jgi:N-acetylglucosaminyldiphosphoundecaprenol N-acetyl-beta-D-mannosaminyltransferase